MYSKERWPITWLKESTVPARICICKWVAIAAAKLVNFHICITKIISFHSYCLVKEATSMKFYMLMWSNYMERTSHFGYFIRLKKKKKQLREKKKNQNKE